MGENRKQTEKAIKDLTPKADEQVKGGDGKDTKRYDRMMELMSSVVKRD